MKKWRPDNAYIAIHDFIRKMFNSTADQMKEQGSKLSSEGVEKLQEFKNVLWNEKPDLNFGSPSGEVQFGSEASPKDSSSSDPAESTSEKPVEGSVDTEIVKGSPDINDNKMKSSMGEQEEEKSKIENFVPPVNDIIAKFNTETPA
eukprot:TRINITY_DN346_c0_g1_i1.p1 TRINITY_DN346_c0_g1~~TRINITY_DN346_c0_g1_i1.p1  ORF type:complete len:146 (-),score=55.59 TRINITY_DN346_c0_g1_i1:148-585(-)